MTDTYMPVGISLKDRPCLVIGGGEVALRKVETLLDYDCRITVVAPQPVDKIEYFAKTGRLTLEKREYRSPEASKYGLVISASSDHDVNKTAAADCKKAGVPVNVVDNPSLCGFIFPAVVKRDNLTVAVLTDGKSPFLAGHLRSILEDIFPKRWEKIAKTAAAFRIKVRERWPKDQQKQAACYGRFVNADWKEILKKKNAADIDREIAGMLEE